MTKQLGHEKTYIVKSFPFDWREFHAWKKSLVIPAVVTFSDDVRTRFACEVMNKYHSRSK